MFGNVFVIHGVADVLSTQVDVKGLPSVNDTACPFPPQEESYRSTAALREPDGKFHFVCFIFLHIHTYILYLFKSPLGYLIK